MTVIDERVSARRLEPPSSANIFGHVIDGERIAASQRRNAGHRRSVYGRRHRQGGSRQRRRRGSGGRVRHAPRSKTAAGATCRRWPRRRVLRNMAAIVAERGELFGEIDVLDAGLLRTYTGFIVQFAVEGIEYFSGWPSKLQGSIPRGAERVQRVAGARADRRRRPDHAVERPDGGVRYGRRRARGGQLGRSSSRPSRHRWRPC